MRAKAYYVFRMSRDRTGCAQDPIQLDKVRNLSLPEVMSLLQNKGRDVLLESKEENAPASSAIMTEYIVALSKP